MLSCTYSRDNLKGARAIQIKFTSRQLVWVTNQVLPKESSLCLQQ